MNLTTLHGGTGDGKIAEPYEQIGVIEIPDFRGPTYCRQRYKIVRVICGCSQIHEIFVHDGPATGSTAI